MNETISETLERRPLDRLSPLPLYAQLVHRLQDLIACGNYPADGFYSENELVAMFDVSRATVRQALQKLSIEGLLSRQRGSRTFVNRDRFDEAFDPSMNLPQQWARSGRPLSLTLVRFESVAATPEVAAALRVVPGSMVLNVDRIRSDPAGQVSYDYRYIHPDLSDSIRRDEAARDSLLDLLKRRVRLRRGENKLEAALAGEEGERLLQVAPESPMLVRETIYYSDMGMPVLFGRSIYPAQRIRCAFTVDLSAGDAPGVSDVRMDNSDHVEAKPSPSS